MSHLDLNSRELQPQGVVTNAEIYTRHMLCSYSGLPCWYPEPRHPVGDRGVVPGDVGTFDLVHGFKKIFNLWEHDCVGSSQLSSERLVLDDYFPEGHIIPSGMSQKTHRSEDGRWVFSYITTPCVRYHDARRKILY